MATKKRRRDIVALWRGRVRKVIAQSSDNEVNTLLRLVWDKRLTHEQRYYVLESAIFDVWSEREADREEEARARRARAREQTRQDRQFRETKKSVDDPA